MSKTILCADDSATMQTVAEITFRATEYEYVGARSADEALSKARANKPALILVDAVMPGKDGYELCKAVKSDPSLNDVPVVMLCGKSQVYDQSKGGDAGADGHLTKPWDSQVMIDKVGEILARTASEGAKASMVAATPAPPTPAPPPRPAKPDMAAANAARSATIMGMPSIQMPPKDMGGASPATSLGTKQASIKPAFTPPTPAPPTPAMPRPAMPKPAPPKPAMALPTPAPPKPAMAPPTPAPATPKGDGASRAPMVKGSPKKRPPVPQRPAATLAARVATKLPSAAEQIALETGLDPKGPEIAALIKVTHEVIERVVWEVVPELAEAMIRENWEDLTRKVGGS